MKPFALERDLLGEIALGHGFDHRIDLALDPELLGLVLELHDRADPRAVDADHWARGQLVGQLADLDLGAVRAAQVGEQAVWLAAALIEDLTARADQPRDVELRHAAPDLGLALGQ
jgi:hypothetical protein